MIKCYYYYSYLTEQYIGYVYVNNVEVTIMSGKTVEQLKEDLMWIYGFNVDLIYMGIRKNKWFDD